MKNLQFTARKNEIKARMEELELELKALNEELALIETEENSEPIVVEKVKTSPKKKAPKLTPVQQRVMDKIWNAPYVDEGMETYLFYDENGYRNMHYFGKLPNGTYRIQENTSTLKALEKKGYIRIIEIGGGMSDIVELLEGTNNSVSIFEEKDMVQVKVEYRTSNGVFNVEGGNGYGHVHNEFMERGAIEHVLAYWDESGRYPVAKITEVETGNVIYTSDKPWIYKGF